MKLRVIKKFCRSRREWLGRGELFGGGKSSFRGQKTLFQTEGSLPILEKIVFWTEGKVP
jgi:hypothetical protein